MKKAAIFLGGTPNYRTDYPAELLEEITEDLALKLANDSKYFLQKKYDGIRKQLKKTADGKVYSYNKHGICVPIMGPLVADLQKIPGSFILDGEQIGKIFYAFDIFERNTVKLAAKPYEERLTLLRKFLVQYTIPFIKISDAYASKTEKLQAFLSFLETRAEGVVFKLRAAPYRAGRNGQHKKFKFWKSCSAIVTQLQPKPGHNSCAIGLYKDGLLVGVGHCSLNGKPTVKVGDVIEVKYLYASLKKQHLYQPSMKCVRTDVNKNECDFTQLVFKGE